MRGGKVTAKNLHLRLQIHHSTMTCGRADRVGCAQLSYVAVDNLPLFYRPYRLQTLLKVCGIDCYDDLLLPGHRLLAQNPLFASGEQFDDAQGLGDATKPARRRPWAGYAFFG